MYFLPSLPVEYGIILYDRLASAIRRDGSHRYAHYAEQIGRAFEGRGGEGTVGRGAFQLRFSKLGRNIIIGARLGHDGYNLSAEMAVNSRQLEYLICRESDIS